MSYVKPFKQCQDNAVGFRTVTELGLSQDAAKEMIELEHTELPADEDNATGFGDLSGGSVVIDPVSSLALLGGIHDTPKVARGLLNVAYDALFATATSTLRLITRTGVCTSFVRLSAGSVFVPISGLTEFYGEGVPLSEDDSTFRDVQVTSSELSAAGQAGATGLYVSLWEQSDLGGNDGFALADFGFQLVVYGRHGESFDPGADGFPWPIIQGRHHRQRRGPPRSSVTLRYA